MTERRLHVSDLPPDGGEVTLDEASSRHVRVWRLRPGDRLHLFDGRGRESEAQVTATGEFVTCKVMRPVEVATEGPRLYLILGLPKGGTLDECVRMATELGVHEIVLLQASRSVPRWDAKRVRSRLERLSRVASEAASQCERADVPIVRAPQALDAVLAVVPSAATRVAYGARAAGTFAVHETTEQVWCAVGPEGGFTDQELAAFERAGFDLASLGPNILRVDTAVVAGLSVLADRLRLLQAR